MAQILEQMVHPLYIALTSEIAYEFFCYKMEKNNCCNLSKVNWLSKIWILNFKNVSVTPKSFDSFIHQAFTECLPLMPDTVHNAKEPETKCVVSVLAQLMNI